MKTKEEIRATTTGKIPQPANYRYGEKLKEWDASLPAGQEGLLEHWRDMRLLNDRLIVRLIDEAPKGTIILTDPKPLIGGMRKAVVLKCGPGRLMVDDDETWRRPMSVKPGQTVYIGNWVDLEADGLALCQEGDVRGYAEIQAATNGSHRAAQVSKGRNKRRAGSRTRVSHAAKTL